MITRRGFLGFLGAALVYETAKPIYIFAPPNGWGMGGLFTPGDAMFFLDAKDWKYRFTYRNSITGHTSDATLNLARLAHNFYAPEKDVIDIYRQMMDGSFDYAETMGVWGMKG